MAEAAGEDLLLTTFLEEIRGWPPGGSTAPGFGFRLNAEDRERVLGRFRSCFEEIAAMPSDPEGEPWSLYLGTHPEA